MKFRFTKESSDIAEHCIVYSMSDGKDTDYRKKCGYQHGIVCKSCHVLASILIDIQTKATTANFATTDDRDEVAYMVNSSKLAIESWQCHIIRCVNQDQARIDILELLDNNTILVVNDWAMKFMPQKYRESQADWYGKRRQIGMAYFSSSLPDQQGGTLASIHPYHTKLQPR